jgi:LmbE family N-acetylglucosaminyl deacetylase
MNSNSLRSFAITTAFLFTVLLCNSQTPKRLNAAEIQMAIKKLDVVGSVLYIAAHPDDENTRLITYFSNEKLLNTAYLSLTRGDGGQNLIGPELNEQLGLIRTQELLQARRTDGGKQFFSRAKDFGFSKNPDETFKIWDREQVLSDVVWVIRKFRPDVLVTRFNTIPGKTHGHHTASAILAGEAFDMAGDPTKFPEQLKYVEVWQPKRVLWNSSSFFYASEKEFIKDSMLPIDVGAYNAYLGKSYTEIASESRSMHKSQGFGSSLSRGATLEYLKPTKGPYPKTDIFEGVDQSWNRIKGAGQLSKTLEEAYSKFNAADPSASVDILLKAKDMMDALPDSYWKKVKQEELQNVIRACLGLYLESAASENSSSPGESVKINIELINRSPIPVEVKKISFTGISKDSSLSLALKNNIDNTFSTYIALPADLPYSQPYWLKNTPTRGMFVVNDRQLIGLPENPPAIEANYTVNIKGHAFTFTSPVIYKKTDQVKGEIYSPFVISPPVFLNIEDKLYVFPDSKPKTLAVHVISGKKNTSGKLSLKLPSGWKSEPASHSFELKAKGQEKTFDFTVYTAEQNITDSIKAIAEINGKEYNNGQVNIRYDHIPAQMLLPQAAVRTIKLDLKKKGESIGYIMGAGDEVPTALRQIGYKVTFLKEDNLQPEKLKAYDAIITGIRAYNTIDKLKARKQALMEYVSNGGNLIVQYNTVPGFNSTELKTALDSIGPYPFKLSNDRVTDEDAEMRILKPESPVLNTPNKITAKDFEGWVQERGLYFPNEWSKEYEAILSCNDPGEKPKDGGLLIAKYGKGYYIYSPLDWFRELPSGVPGAYRLFTNIISLGKK